MKIAPDLTEQDKKDITDVVLKEPVSFVLVLHKSAILNNFHSKSQNWAGTAMYLRRLPYIV